MNKEKKPLNIFDLVKEPLYKDNEAIFITGATGFLGGHYLYWKLHSTGKVFVLCRGESQEQAEERVRKNLSQCAKSYNLPDIPENILSERLICVRGDLKQTNLGLSNDQLDQLRFSAVSEILHFAASLSFRWADKDKIDATNIKGTQHILSLANDLNVSRFIYISTAYTAGKQSGVIEEKLHSSEVEFANYYEESKCAAEHLIDKYTKDQNIACTIVRPAIVIGPELTQCSGGTRFGIYGFFQEMNQMQDTLSQVKRKLRLIGNPDSVGNFIPVDQVVLDLLYLRAIGYGDQQIYHSVNSTDLKLFDVIKQCEKYNAVCEGFTDMGHGAECFCSCALECCANTMK